MKVGDVVKLPKGCSNHWGLPTGIAVLVEKTPRTDNLEYDWNVFVDGRFISRSTNPTMHVMKAVKKRKNKEKR